MKKTILLIATLVFAATACDIYPTEEQTAETASSITVVSSDVFFPPQGGEGSIVVKASGNVSALSSESWCTVSVSANRYITVTADQAVSNQSRYAKITLRCGSDETYVVAEQTGIIIHTFAPGDYLEFAKEGGVVCYPYVSETPITITSSADWLIATVNEDGLTIFVNEYDSFRSGHVDWKIQGYESGSIEVRQDGRWRSIGNCQYTDAFISALFNVDDLTYEVEVQKSLVNDGVFRLVNPYGEAYEYNDPGDYQTKPYHYMVVNASNRDAVFIQEFHSGMDWGYGEFILSSSAPGTLKDKVITFPANGLQVKLDNPEYPNPFPANENGTFKIDLTQLNY